jgi:hypothetical protein
VRSGVLFNKIAIVFFKIIIGSKNFNQLIQATNASFIFDIES